MVVATPLDREHIHNHFVLNSISFADGKKYNDCKATYALMRQTSDQLCREHGLSVIENPEQGRTMSRDTWEAEQKGKPTWYSQIRADVDSCITRSFLFEHFIANLKKQGYEVKTGKYIAVRPPGRERFVRLKTLGDNYTEEMIRQRIRDHERTSLYHRPLSWPKRYYKTRGKSRKLTGFRALYYHYLYLLGKLQKPTAPPKRRRYNMAEVIKFDRYVEQAKLLMKYKVDTWDQFYTLAGAIQGEIDALADQRKELYRQKRREPQNEPLSLRIRSINQSIQTYRRELRICARIEAEAPDIQAKIRMLTPAPEKEKKPPIHRRTRPLQR